jgi:hypothetical protein
MVLEMLIHLTICTQSPETMPFFLKNKKFLKDKENFVPARL